FSTCLFCLARFQRAFFAWHVFNVPFLPGTLKTCPTLFPNVLSVRSPESANPHTASEAGPDDRGAFSADRRPGNGRRWPRGRREPSGSRPVTPHNDRWLRGPRPP